MANIDQGIFNALKNYNPNTQAAMAGQPNAAEQGAGSPGFFSKVANFYDNPENRVKASLLLDALGGIVNPSQRGFTPGSDMMRSDVAAKAAQKRFTAPNRTGPTKETISVGPDGRQIRTTVETLPDDEPQKKNPFLMGDALAGGPRPL